MKDNTMSMWRRLRNSLPWRLRMLGLRKRRATVSDLAIALVCFVTLVVLSTSLFSLLGMPQEASVTPRLALTLEEVRLRRWWARQMVQDQKRWQEAASRVRIDRHPKNVESYLKNGTFRPSACRNCTHFTQTFLVHPSACSGEVIPLDQPVHVLILVSTAPSAYEQRMAIRQTWASASLTAGSGVQHAFVLGLWGERQGEEKVLEESEVHRDILLVDFLDAYQNLTLKTMAGLRWASKHCPQARSVLKCDDDVWLNLPALVKRVRFHDDRPTLAGYCVEGMPPNRDSNSKWYASFLSHPTGRYPTFCFGPGYLLSRSAVKAVLAASPDVPFFHLEDVFTAMCANAAAVHISRLDGFFNRPLETDACTHRSSQVLLAHDYKPQLLRDIWAASCSARDIPRPPPLFGHRDRHHVLSQRALKHSRNVPFSSSRTQPRSRRGHGHNRLRPQLRRKKVFRQRNLRQRPRYP